MLDIFDDLFDLITDFVCVPSGIYSRGLLVGASLVVIFALCYRETIRDWKKIQAFFKPIDPSLKPSPSGYQSMVDCLGGLLRLFLLYLILLSILSGFVFFSIRP
jgi:hypothetical protein